MSEKNHTSLAHKYDFFTEEARIRLEKKLIKEFAQAILSRLKNEMEGNEQDVLNEIISKIFATFQTS